MFFIQNHILSLAVQCHLFAYFVHTSTLIMKATLLNFLVLFLVLLNTAESSRTLFLIIREICHTTNGTGHK